MRRHHFTVDVEEYFQVSAFERCVDRDDWEDFESRIAYGLEPLLELLARTGTKATFFVLGWIAERHPALVREVASAGHEIASHGWAHRRVTEQGREEFRAGVRRSKQVLEEAGGQAVVGFRAPSFSIVPGREWALDVLIEEGYLYDSSLFPVRRRAYGHPDARRDPHWIARPAGRILELPPATLRKAGVNLPAAGGAYFRLLPYGLVRGALGAAERRGVSATFYIHPWELDEGQPRLDVRWPTRVRHYAHLSRTRVRLARLLDEFRFTAIAETVAGLRRPLQVA